VSAEGGAYRTDERGWASVGDRARPCGDGRLILLGRPDAATVAGHTVVLAEVEAVLAQAPGVRELICLAQPHPRLGERVVAVVEPLPGLDPVPDLRALAAAALDPPARPARYLVQEIARTPAGKPDRAGLAALLA
jgi:acyl-coenzyme A synthetase/AMP-(fatty) acid ligase